jgi:hypothetical protein
VIWDNFSAHADGNVQGLLTQMNVENLFLPPNMTDRLQVCVVAAVCDDGRLWIRSSMPH